MSQALRTNLFILKIFLLISVGLACYANSFHASFQYDDYAVIVNNYAIFNLGNLKAIWNFYHTRFIGMLSFALNYHFHGTDVFGYHVVNFAIHLINAFLVWFLVALTLATRDTLHATRNNLSPVTCHVSRVTAFFAALLFLIHPLQTEAVTYIYQRITALATLFYLASLCFYIKARVAWELNGGKGKTFVPALASLVTALLAMFTKELSITLPLMVLFYELFWFRSPRQVTSDKRQPVTCYVSLVTVCLFIFLIIPAMYGLDIKGFLTTPQISESHAGDTATLGSYLLTQLRIIVLSWRLFLFPMGQNVHWDIALSKSLWEWPTFLSLLTVLGVGIFAWKVRTKVPMVSFGIFWFFIAYSSNLVPRTHIFFEHWLYLPLVGLCLAASEAATFVTRNTPDIRKNIGRDSDRIENECRKRQVTRVACRVSLVTILIVLTFHRNQIWQTPTAFWQDIVKKSPQQAIGYQGLGRIYYDQGMHDTAFAYFNQALSRDPNYVEAYLSRGQIFKLKKDFDHALADYDKALQLSKPFAQSYAFNNRGDVYYAMGRYDLALTDYDKALAIQVNYPNALNNRGMVYLLYKKFDLALADFNTALKLNPQYAYAYSNRGVLYMIQKEYGLAIKDFQEALKINPQLGMVSKNLAIAQRLVPPAN